MYNRSSVPVGNRIYFRRMLEAMPTYVYACESCKKQFEVFQSFKDEPLNVCRCGEVGKVRRVIQPAGIVFKGSGWYINDSRGAGTSAIGTDTPKAEAAEKTEKAESSEKSTASDAATTSDA